MARRRVTVIIVLVAMLIAYLSRAVAQGDDLEDVLGGFGEEGTEDAQGVQGAAEESNAVGAGADWWELTGSIGITSSINYLDHRSATGTDYTGLQKLRERLNLQLDFELRRGWKVRLGGYAFYDSAYRIQGRGNYTQDVLDEYEWEVDSQEMYVSGTLADKLDLKVGRLIVNWGRSETLRVLDVLNPLDNREPGLVDIEDLRLPVGMARVDYYLGSWSLTAISIPEIRFDKVPPVGSDFVPSAEPLSPELTPAVSLDDSEWAAAASGIFSGWDLSLHFVRYWDDAPHVAPGAPTVQNPSGLVREHSRLMLGGGGGNYTFGSWLLKMEVAYIDGADYTVTEGVQVTPLGPVPIIGTAEKSRLDVMGGIEYYGITDTSIALDIVDRHINDFEARMGEFDAREDAFEGALRISSNFMHARLHTTVLGVIFGERAQDGSVVRLGADYDLRDALVVTAGVLMFQNGDPVAFSKLDDNDRLFFEVKYSF